MSTNLGPNLPDSLVSLFSGTDLQSKAQVACVLVTEGADGYPHPCIVTPGELVAHNPTTLRLALYETSSASRNLRSRPTATLCLADQGAAYYVKADVEPFEAPDGSLPGQAVFTMRPRHVLRDVEEGYEVTSGFRFRDLAGDQATIARWEPVVSALRATFA
jgi:hypothetical protein